jgi:hypothetical protein
MKVLIFQFFYRSPPQYTSKLKKILKNPSNAYGVVNTSIKDTKVRLNELY